MCVKLLRQHSLSTNTNGGITNKEHNKLPHLAVMTVLDKGKDEEQTNDVLRIMMLRSIYCRATSTFASHALRRSTFRMAKNPRKTLKSSVNVALPNHDCCSFWTSMARPKSASLTEAPLTLLARRRFSGCQSNKKALDQQRYPMQRLAFTVRRNANNIRAMPLIRKNYCNFIHLHIRLSYIWPHSIRTRYAGTSSRWI